MRGSLFTLLLMGLLVSCEKETTESTTQNTTNQPLFGVTQVNTALLQKFTGTRCAPCGEWGWTTAEELITYGGVKVLYLGSYSRSVVAEGLTSDEATAMAEAWGVPRYPVFAVNGNLRISNKATGLNPQEEKAMCEQAIDSFSRAEVIANSASTFRIQNSTMQINATVKFFKAVEGTYHIAFYVAEDSAMWAQDGNPASNGVTPIPHRQVLRASANGTWGEVVMSGSIAAGSYKNLNVSYAIPAGWNQQKLSVYAVIWKTNGGRYDFINVSLAGH